MSGMKKSLVYKFAKGFRGRAKNCHRIARNRVEKSLQHAYKGRKLKKRDNREVWIQKINAGARQHGVSYNRFICALKDSSIGLNRKMLAELAENEPFSFKSLVMEVKPTETTESTQLRDLGYVGMRLGVPNPTISTKKEQEMKSN
eukprot:CAMPEP_0185263682 /NCGR_PEP_ID=MMETSP1359-20130426/15752_1 /TAXON_ID=552665 /ORGANISM="Bigelowiella longifila, Strain CCMP242" /LENGTH=144 /DNA_ID=CAMNT_0027851377 /DNA_START=63 /DNA_END=497 /DNA_ORIENTATION=-